LYKEFLKVCDTQDLEAVMTFYHDYYQPYDDDRGSIFAHLCENNYFEIARWYFSIHPDMSKRILNDMVMCVLCPDGNFEMTQWIFSIHTHMDDETKYCGFQEACAKGHVRLAQWIYSNGFGEFITKSLRRMYFINCHRGHMEMAEWVFSLEPDMDLSPVDYYSLQEIAETFIKKNKLQEAEWFFARHPEAFRFMYDAPDVDISDSSSESEHKLNLFESKCRNGELEMARWLYSTFSTSEHLCSDYAYIFRDACENGKLEVAQWLLSIKPDIDICDCDNYAFSLACENGHLEIAQWILRQRPDIDLRVEDDIYFCIACESGQLEIAQWLLSVQPDINIRADDDYSFKTASENGHQHIVDWLISLLPDIYSYELGEEDEENVTILFRIRNIPVDYIPTPREIPSVEIEDCSICYGEKSQIITECNHQFCKRCIDTWLIRQSVCPYCRNPLLHHNLFCIVSK
jgi:hypothetical protein